MGRPEDSFVAVRNLRTLGGIVYTGAKVLNPRRDDFDRLSVRINPTLSGSGVVVAGVQHFHAGTVLTTSFEDPTFTIFKDSFSEETEFALTVPYFAVAAHNLDEAAIAGAVAKMENSLRECVDRLLRKMCREVDFSRGNPSELKHFFAAGLTDWTVEESMESDSQGAKWHPEIFGPEDLWDYETESKQLKQPEFLEGQGVW